MFHRTIFLNKKFPKIFTVVFLSLVILQTGAFIFSSLLYTPTNAQTKFVNPTDNFFLTKFSTPTACVDDATKTCVPWIGDYIANIYKYGIGIVGILAAVVLMFGGVVWLTAGGNQSRIGEAKSWITASLTGLVLALTSYMILYQINPDLVNSNPLRIKSVDKIEIAVIGCGWQKLFYINTGASRDTEKCSKYNLTEASSDSKCKEKKPNAVVTSTGTTVATGYLYSCCCDSEIGAIWSFDTNIEKQAGDASASLNEMLTCMKQKLPAGVGRISSISDSNYVGTPSSCYNNGCKSLTPACVHSCTSCHYGRGSSDNKSHAVDFGDEENKVAIKAAALQCGGKPLDEGNHIHVSAPDCPSLQ